LRQRGNGAQKKKGAKANNRFSEKVFHEFLPSLFLKLLPDLDEKGFFTIATENCGSVIA
jgi:hypothetical protein